jgi:hypothetical protein
MARRPRRASGGFGWGDDAQADSNHAGSDGSEVPSSGIGEIENAIASVWTAVIDPYLHASPIGPVLYDDPCAEGQARVRSGHLVHVKDLPARGASAVVRMAVPRGLARFLVANSGKMGRLLSGSGCGLWSCTGSQQEDQRPRLYSYRDFAQPHGHYSEPPPHWRQDVATLMPAAHAPFGCRHALDAGERRGYCVPRANPRVGICETGRKSTTMVIDSGPVIA